MNYMEFRGELSKKTEAVRNVDGQNYVPKLIGKILPSE